MKKSIPSFITWRFYLVLIIVFTIVAGLVARLFDLAIVEQPFLEQQGNERVLRLVNTPAFRGMILDRNGYPLAVSTVVYSAWMNPKEVSLNATELHRLSTLLNMTPRMLDQLLIHYKKTKKEFVYLRRALSPEVSNQIKSNHFKGIYLQQEYRRYYPEGEIAAHVVGMTNIDDQGQEGMELGYNNWLQGEPGKKWVIKDRLGNIIQDVKTIQSQKTGHTLSLSIDRRIQYLAYRALLAGVKEKNAKSGSAVVLDVKTGEILAMANIPAFNPNNRSTRNRDNLRNRAITDTFEPGSTIKAFTVASALEAGTITKDSVINTSPGWMRVDHNVVKDEKNNGPLTVTQILQISSNMGASKIALALPPNQLWSLLHRVGFGETTNINFPGEQIGMLTPLKGFPLATLSFGYGMSATTLQLAIAYSIFATHGIKVTPSLLKIEATQKSQRVIQAKVADEMLNLMSSVLNKGGTAEAARVPGYHVAGKTGTARKVGQKGYEQHQYTSSFVGIAPLSHPRLVVAVVVHDPQGKYYYDYYGGFVAGPIFSNIMEGALRVLDVPPDDNTMTATR